ncbi:MAG: 2,3-bisphosphoglycerate-independent phosphoglycerate mutase [Bacteroidota bacterium]
MAVFDRFLLVILDGWGHGQDPKVSALAQAKTPFVDSLYKNYPNSELVTYGRQVGLPEGQMGNSEVGHLNIGAGRVVYQELARINKSIEDGELQRHPILLEKLKSARDNGNAVHFMGLVSDGGVHSHISHIKALCDIAEDHGPNEIFVHAFLDGRDTDPNGGENYISDLQNHLTGKKAKIASLIGRYYAMDRYKRWERIKLAYDLLVEGKGAASTNPVDAIKASYNADLTDEFMLPVAMVDTSGNVIGQIKENDLVICFNFRTDRCREITQVLTQRDMPEADMKTIPLQYVTMTNYDKTYENIQVLFEKEDLKRTIGEVLSNAGKSQLRLAETEKYPHVTYFLSGGREAEFEGEKRIVIQSPKVATYDLKPEMSALEVTLAVLAEIDDNQPDFICLNYANTDMVGHTGVFEAAVKAAETVDNCVEQLVAKALDHNYGIIIIADHGNSDTMVNPDGSPHTAHTTNPVPCFFIANDVDSTSLANGKLADIAPTILTCMGIEIPEEMNGSILIKPVEEASV